MMPPISLESLSTIHFGAPVSHENDTERALDFVLELRRLLGQLTRLRAGVTRDIRYVGWNGGTRRQEFACLGRATNLAARLCSDAGPWQVLVTDRILAAIENVADAEVVGDVQPKGFSRTVRVHNISAMNEVST